jgi:hypothetical protein
MSADPICTEGPFATTEFYVTEADGGLANVFVYIKAGLENRTFPPPSTRVVLDAKNCRFVPHVLGVQVGQVLEVVNSDLTLHWVRNKQINFALAIPGLRFAHTFTSQEVMMDITDQAHPWMSAYVGIVNHPFFAVSDKSGRFEIRGLPAGTYLLEAWHEKLGRQTQIVTVGVRETKGISFTYKIP